MIERAAKGRTVFEIEVQPGASAAELHSAVASRVEHQPTGRFVEIELVDGACCGSSHFVFQLPIVLRALAARGGSEEGSEESTSDGNGSSSDGEGSEPAQYVGTVPPVMYGRILTELQATFHATEIQSLSLGNARVCLLLSCVHSPALHSPFQVTPVTARHFPPLSATIRSGFEVA